MRNGYSAVGHASIVKSQKRDGAVRMPKTTCRSAAEIDRERRIPVGLPPSDVNDGELVADLLSTKPRPQKAGRHKWRIIAKTSITSDSAKDANENGARTVGNKVCKVICLLRRQLRDVAAGQLRGAKAQ
jgi:hypothetical protein